MKTHTNDFCIDFLQAKKYRLLRHLAVLLFLFAVIINSKNSNPNQYATPYAEDFILLFSFFNIVMMFYLNMYCLVPGTLYKKKNFILYLVGLSAIVFTGVLLMILFAQLFKKSVEGNNIHTLSYFFTILIDLALKLLPVILASTTIKLFQRWIRDSERLRELENQALTTELKALKNQINPHFLFNMLNNLNVLIRRDQEKASYVTIKLSDFLRHHLYENNSPQIALDSELKFIEDFLNLEKIRRDDFTFKLNISIPVTTGITIPSNIFSVFVENAIKHSLDSDMASDIQVNLQITANNNLLFECINSKPILNEKAREKHGGIGLVNIKRRLELLYGKKFSLSIIDLERIYKVELKLPVEQDHIKV